MNTFFYTFIDADQNRDNQIDSTVNDGEDEVALTNNGIPILATSYNTRKSRKRKRHYNVNKNKQKWNKSYKRQKSANTTKTDTENISQNSRNKHVYTKATKTVFNNKQTLHRGNGLSKFFLPDKRPRKDIIVPPTKFLLGGNISDPLNLNSLQDEALVSSMSAVTPKSSPITTPPKVELIIPPNICDPLHLLDPVDSIEYEKQLVSPVKIRRLNKQRSRKKKIRKSMPNDLATDGNETSGEAVVESSGVLNATLGVDNVAGSGAIESADTNADTIRNVQSTEEKLVGSRGIRELHLDLPAINIFGRKRKNSENSGSLNVSGGNNTAANGSTGGKTKLRRFESKDKIVSPVIPQPGAWKRLPKVLPTGAPRNRNRTTSASGECGLCSYVFFNFMTFYSILNDITHFQYVESEAADESSYKRVETCTQDEVRAASATSSESSKGRSPEKALSIECESSSSIPPEIIDLKLSTDDTINAKQEQVKYQYGNYAGQYCGLQSLHSFLDVRLTVFLRHAYLFRDKDMLDIGCNVGHMTLAVAQRLQPRSIVGIDIDRNLIARARRNLAMFHRIPNDEISKTSMVRKLQPGTSAMAATVHSEGNANRPSMATKKHKWQRLRDRDRTDTTQSDYFPVSFPICFGGMPHLREKAESPSASPASGGQNSKATETSEKTTDDNQLVADSTTSPNQIKDSVAKADENDVHYSNSFPKNVSFRTLNYAVTDESQMCADKQQYDLILCLSLTKWIHLNFGDAGLKMTFRRMFNQLRPGGKLILEAQNWASYRKRKKLTVFFYNFF